MPEGDTIHRAARADERGARRAARSRSPTRPTRARRSTPARPSCRGGRSSAPRPAASTCSPTSPAASSLHSHLGMNGRWWIAADGRLPLRQALAAARLGARDRLAERRQDPAAGQRVASCATTPRCAASAPTRCAPGSTSPRRPSACARPAAGREIGDALLDQGIIAGIGNAIRVEALFRRAGRARGARSRSSNADELELVVAESERVMRTSIAKGRRPRSIYRANRAAAVRAAAARVQSRGQGDDNRTAYWCPRCQP